MTNRPVRLDRPPARRQANANARFKARFGVHLWTGVGIATALHFAVFALFPTFTAADTSVTTAEFTALELPPEIRVPPPPEEIRRPAVPKVATHELDDDVTIAPTTIDENPIETLPPPPGAADRAADEPFVTPVAVAPELRDHRAALRIVERAYPSMLKQVGIGGQVVVWAYIDEEGRVRDARVAEGSGNARLDEAALRAVRQFEYRPAVNLDRKVPIWIQQRITFEVR